MSAQAILFNEQTGAAGNLGVVTLNRPKALNALTQAMCIALDKQLTQWEQDDKIKAVVIRAAEGRAFCAGGDIRHIYEAGKAGDISAQEFFMDEYRLNKHIYHYKKPYIALLDGITMGGGVGISVHGSHRIATENTLFAMPETGIGFFPDVGGSYFLPRCPGEIGTYLGLTGARLNAADTVYAEIASHFVPANQLDDLVASLAATPFTEQVTENHIINDYATTVTSSLHKNTETINACFAAHTVEAIFANLAKHGDEWSQKTLRILQSKSPLSMKVTLQQIRNGAKLDFDACMEMEYTLTKHFLQSADFYEGVRAVIIDKDQAPQWQPIELSAVSSAQVDAFFV